MQHVGRRVVRALLLAALVTVGLGNVVAAQETPAADLSGELTLWHGWTGAEADTLNNDLLPAWETAYPNVTIEALAVPFDQLKNKYSTEAATGGGPDLLIGPLDWVGELASGELIRPVDDLADDDFLSNYVPTTVDALRYEDQLYGIPESLETVALYYNKDLIATAPTTTAELEAMAAGVTDDGTYGFALLSNFYHPAGYLFGYGAELFTDENTSALNSPETVSFLTWLQELKAKPGIFMQNDDAAISSLFKEGKAGMVINGPWALGDYQTALGEEKVGVAPLPAISANGDAAAKPFLGVKHLMINNNVDDEQAQLAFEFAKWFTSPESEQLLVDNAGHLPAHTGVDVSGDPTAQAFVTQAESASPLPTIPEMGQVWEPAGAMITAVLEGDSTPEEAAQQAQEQIDQSIESMGG